MEFKIGLAGRIVGISSIYDEVYELCRDYLVGEGSLKSCEDEPVVGDGALKSCDDVIAVGEDFHVTTSQVDIEFEREKSIREAIFEGIVPYDYEESYYETLAVYRKIAVEMLKYDTWLMHGAVVGVNDQAVLFTAQSGVGKTTHMNLWLKYIPGAFVVNGDKPLLKFVDDGCEVCGTPWAGKEALQTNTILPLKAICLLERGDTNEIERVAFEDVYPMLFQQVYRPSDPLAMMKTMELIKRLGETIPLYRMKCTMEPEAAKVAYEGMV